MNYLFFDVETTGFPADYNRPATDLENWPRIVQLAIQVCDEQGNAIKEFCSVVKPDGYFIPNNVIMIHGITNEYANEAGLDIATVLLEFVDALTYVDTIVCHNVDYDLPILTAEFYRIFRACDFLMYNVICMQKQTTDYICIEKQKGQYGNDVFKWPSLAELYMFCTGLEIERAYDALEYVRVTSRCFFYMKDRYPDIFALPYISRKTIPG